MCRHLQGFQQLKVLRNGRQVSCFVEFDTTENASQTHTTQQVRCWPAGLTIIGSEVQLNSMSSCSISCFRGSCSRPFVAVLAGALLRQWPALTCDGPVHFANRLALHPASTCNLTVPCCCWCHCCCAAVQGAVLASSDRGPIRIQFSKNPFGKKRDVSGALIDTRMSAGGSGLEGMPSFDPAMAQPTMS